MAPVYSTQFMLVSGATLLEYVVPTGFIAIVRDFETWYLGGPDNVILFSVDETVIQQLNFAADETASNHQDFRIVVNAGSTIRVSSTHAADWYLGGYLLTAQ